MKEEIEGEGRAKVFCVRREGEGRKKKRERNSC
jgi:hypothetical protein